MDRLISRLLIIEEIISELEDKPENFSDIADREKEMEIMKEIKGHGEQNEKEKAQLISELRKETVDVIIKNWKDVNAQANYGKQRVAR